VVGGFDLPPVQLVPGNSRGLRGKQAAHQVYAFGSFLASFQVVDDGEFLASQFFGPQDARVAQIAAAGHGQWPAPVAMLGGPLGDILQVPVPPDVPAAADAGDLVKAAAASP